MMIMMPDYVDEATFRAGSAKAREKLGALSESLRLEPLEEGLCLQALHIGSYDDEGPLLAGAARRGHAGGRVWFCWPASRNLSERPAQDCA